MVGEEGTLYNFSILHTLQRPPRKAVKGELLGLRGVHSKKWFFLHRTTDTQCRLRNPSCLKTRRRLEETGSQESCSRVQIIDSSNYLDLTLPFLSLKSSKVLGKISPRPAYTICLNSMVITCTCLFWEQGKKVFKSYCGPMLSLFCLDNAPRAQYSKRVTPTPRATVLSV